MVSKKLGEEEIKNMFNQFGAIEDCTVLRDDNGISRGEKIALEYLTEKNADCAFSIKWRILENKQLARFPHLSSGSIVYNLIILPLDRCEELSIRGYGVMILNSQYLGCAILLCAPFSVKVSK